MVSSNVTYEQSYILRNLYEVTQALSKSQPEGLPTFTKSVLVQNYLKKEWGK